MRLLKELKRKMKQVVKSERKEALRKTIDEVERLRAVNPAEFWKKLKVIAHWQRDSKPVSAVVVGENGDEVEAKLQPGKYMSLWKQTYEKIEKEGGYDEKYREKVEDEVKAMESNADAQSDGELGGEIKRDEVMAVATQLQNNKGVGVDGLLAELFKQGGEDAVTALWKMCNCVFMAESAPLQWARGVIIPIHKDGDARVRNNYRPITLLGVVRKVFSAVLNKRLSDFVERRGVLVDEQAGFRPGRCCMDQLFILTEAIRWRRSQRKNKKTYCCFVDIRKAYDTVWRDGLWKRLWEVGVRGRMWRMLRNMYAKTESCVEVDGKQSSWFEVKEGVMQGCVLSPLLYAVFIDGLARQIKEQCRGVVVDGIRVQLLLYADDIVLMAESAEELQSMLTILHDYSKKWRFDVNVGKTKVVVFGAPEVGVSGSWKCGEKEVEEKKVYKYLGVELTANLTWSTVKSRMLKKARRNMYMAWAMGVRGGFLTPAAAVNIYKGVVRACLEYGAECFGDVVWEKAERVQYEMGRKILQVGRNFPACAARGELGLWKLRARRDLLRLMYWSKMVGMGDERLVKRMYLVSKFASSFHGHKNWCSATRKVLLKYGLGRCMRTFDDKVGVDWRKVVKEKIEEKEQEEWKNETGATSRLGEYVKVKKKLEFEIYLRLENSEARRLISRVRCGGGDLRVESARGVNRLERKERVCEVCGNGEVEDERHALLRCPAYADLRQRWGDQFRAGTDGVVKWEELDDDGIVGVMMASKELVPDALSRKRAAGVAGAMLAQLFARRTEVLGMRRAG